CIIHSTISTFMCFVNFIYVCTAFSSYYTHTPTTPFYTLSLHDALPIFLHSFCRYLSGAVRGDRNRRAEPGQHCGRSGKMREKSRSEEHTSELQSRFDLVCRLLLEKKNKNQKIKTEKDQLQV